LDLAIQVSGHPGSPALLLLQGQANSHVWWDDLRSFFDAEFRVVTFDYRGTGDTGSADDETEWTTGSFARDAVAVLDELGIDQAHVYGTSMGGRVAQMLAAEHPSRVGRMVLACSSPGGPHASERSQAVRRSLADPDPVVRRTRLLSLMYTDERLARTTCSRLLGDPTMTPDSTRRHLRVSNRHDAWDLLPRISAPTFVLHGTDDEMVPVSNAELIAGRIPDAAVWQVPGGRHGFFDEFSDEVSPRVSEFLLG
jgi:3-oxoadipate enol-lactonase